MSTTPTGYVLLSGTLQSGFTAIGPFAARSDVDGYGPRANVVALHAPDSLSTLSVVVITPERLRSIADRMDNDPTMIHEITSTSGKTINVVPPIPLPTPKEEQ